MFLIILRHIQCLSTFGTVLMLPLLALYVRDLHVSQSYSLQSQATIGLPRNTRPVLCKPEDPNLLGWLYALH